MESMDAFFDEHSDFYGNVKPLKSDIYFINYIKNKNNFQKKFLDIGGGSGIFSRLLKENCPEIEVNLIDPSLKMLEKNFDKSINKYQGYLPNNLNIPKNKKFNYILLKEVLHHITGRSIKKSKELAVESLINVHALIEYDGYLMIHELFFESFIYPPISRTMIFYLLKFQNILRIEILPKEFILGLNVCFYTRDELQHFIHLSGYVIIDEYKEDWSNNLVKKGLFLKNWGRILYILARE